MNINEAGDWMTTRTMYNKLIKMMRAADSMQIMMIVVYWLLRSEPAGFMYLWKYNTRAAIKTAAKTLITIVFIVTATLSP